MKTPLTMTVLLLATTLGVQAQSYTSPATSSSAQTEEQRRQEQTQSPSTSTNPSGQAYPGANQSATGAAHQSETAEQRRQREAREKNDGNGQPTSRYSINDSSPSSQSSSSTELKYRSNQPADVQKDNSQASTSSTQASTSQTGASTQTGTQTDVALTAQTETEVRTVVQQIDAQGPVVVERISTEFADATCTQQNARALIEGLHNGTAVTLRNENGQTATFTPTAQLGYGDAYIAMAVAVQALREAGITGCASPAQWQAVLLGGELAGPGIRTTAVTTERFPGVLTLHSQGGWTKVAQTTHVQLNQVVSQANSSLQINDTNTSSTAQSTSTTPSSQQSVSEVGRPRDYDPRASDKAKDEAAKAKDKDNDNEKDHPKSAYDQDQKKDDMNSSDTEHPPKTGTPPKL